MSGPITIDDGQLLTKDPADTTTKTFTWDDFLTAGVTIASIVITVTGLSGDVTLTPLTASTASPLGIQAGSRTVKVQLTAGALGSKWRIDCKITTNETPADIIERSCLVKVENK